MHIESGEGFFLSANQAPMQSEPPTYRRVRDVRLGGLQNTGKQGAGIIIYTHTAYGTVTHSGM